jgi:hypothetical protein
MRIIARDSCAFAKKIARMLAPANAFVATKATTERVRLRPAMHEPPQVRAHKKKNESGTRPLSSCCDCFRTRVH